MKWLMSISYEMSQEGQGTGLRHVAGSTIVGANSIRDGSLCFVEKI
jgi:hypothetical protein